ncbi:MAG TPA: hypothetical protein VK815_14235 [Candidatus Acidoferrales bacterium]|jgi:hypothetical protein|nr:hypothetical protein [Candidatus Acidoferrales bacterium]
MPLPANSQIACPACGAFFPQPGVELRNLLQCPACWRPTEIAVFPAYDRPVTAGTAAEKVVMDGEATCFYHSNHRALIPCDACGRFLCALCDLDLNGRHFCPPCLELATTKKTVQALERDRTRWDKIIFTLLAIPIVFCFAFAFVPFTSLAALVLVAWKWGSPGSLVSNTRVRFVIYGVLAMVEFVTGGVFWWMMFIRPHP